MADTATLDAPVTIPASPAPVAAPPTASGSAPVVEAPKAAEMAAPVVAIGTPPEPPAEVKDTVPPVTAVPATYELKLPANSTLDPDALERTAATARALGLDNEKAQATLDFVNSEVQRLIAAEQPQGEQWGKRVDDWNAQSLADPEIGGSPERLTATVTAATKVLSQLGTPELGRLLSDSGYGSHPEVVRFFAKAAKALGEGDLILPTVAGTSGTKTTAEYLYGGPPIGSPSPTT